LSEDFGFGLAKPTKSVSFSADEPLRSLVRLALQWGLDAALAAEQLFCSQRQTLYKSREGFALINNSFRLPSLPAAFAPVAS
jgi:hypothetical protein